MSATRARRAEAGAASRSDATSGPADNRGLFQAFVGYGDGLIALTGFVLAASGLGAFFLAATGHFLPHDIAYLGMTAEQLRSVADSRVVHFMIHDRVAFGGSIIAVGTQYLWLALFPLRQGQVWAWWALAISAVVGFGSFLTYLGYGYLDTWHGFATLALLPVFLVGLVRSRRVLCPRGGVSTLFVAGYRPKLRTKYGIGWALILATGTSLLLGGATVMGVGMTSVFVPQDLAFMGLTSGEVAAISPKLVPLIAHDRAGFGGGVCCCGLTMIMMTYCGRPSKALWQTLAIVGIAGFGSAVGVHFLIGYTDFLHLSPAYLGVLMYVAALSLTYPRMVRCRSDAE